MRQPAETRRPARSAPGSTLTRLAIQAALLTLSAGLASGARAEAGLSLAPAGIVRPAGQAPALKLPRPGGELALSYVPRAGDKPGPGRTALDRRVGDGLNASVGYLCGIDRYAPDSYQRGGGPDTAYGHKGTFLGASLGYVFR